MLADMTFTCGGRTVLVRRSRDGGYTVEKAVNGAAVRIADCAVREDATHVFSRETGMIIREWELTLDM